MSDPNTCSKCGAKSVLKGEIGLRTSRDLELIMVVRKDHGIGKKSSPPTAGLCPMRIC